MNQAPARLYLHYRDDILHRLEEALEKALANINTARPLPVFFRADDIGVYSSSFNKLMSLFDTHQAPLCLAVVPAWLTQRRWAIIKAQWKVSSALWCWHQHGWRHANHEPSGKKCEFGPSRSAADIRSDLTRGKARLSSIIGADLQPFFTPPWNRCSEKTLALLKELQFKAVSTSTGRGPWSTPASKRATLDDYRINVDLHTRKETDPVACLNGLVDEFSQAASLGHIGIMIHHQRMNEAAFAMLDGLLRYITRTPRLRALTFNGFSSKS
jgi:peptidoglycan/xylan/chitin deacetylase (PgdA/CDA1 family)